jgi:uncharacterized coiled-coil protein SlyX
MHALADAVGAARLGMLQSLMDAKKRAEALEQEYLNKMHSENAAFTQLANSYDESIQSLRADFSSRLESLSSETKTHLIQVSESAAASDAAILDLKSTIADRRDHLLSELDQVKVSSMETSAELSSRLDVFSAEVSSQTSSLVVLVDHVQTRLDNLEAQVSLISANLSADLESRLATLESRVSLSEKTQREEFSNQASSLQSSIDSVSSSIFSYIDSHVSSLEQRLSESISGIGLNQINLDKQSLQMTASFKSLSSAVADQNLDLAQHKQVYDLYTQYVDAYFTRINTQFHNLYSAGLYYEWTVAANADQSPVFSLSDMFSTCFFRLFPSSSTIWFVWKPQSSSGNPSVLVDIAMDNLKLCGISPCRKDQLHGHWIWEAAFPEHAAAFSVVSVEISLRQWLVDKSVQHSLRADHSAIQWTSFDSPTVHMSTSRNPFDHQE